MPNNIENVTLVKVYPEGTQEYTWGSSQFNVIFLSGLNKADNVKVGDQGRLVYKIGASSALWFFEKYNTSNLDSEFIENLRIPIKYLAIDHLDYDSANNRLDNLRLIDIRENRLKTGVNKNFNVRRHLET